MKVVYSIGIRCYYFLIVFSSLFNSKAKRWLQGRRNIFSSLKDSIGSEKGIAWFHCASLGEFEQGRPVIEEYKKRFPSKKILLTFFSPSGYEMRKNYSEANWVFYMPLDTRKNAKRFLDIINPDIVLFVKYEFWLHFLGELNKRRIPTFLISANFRKDQMFFKSYGSWYRKALSYFSFLFVQNEESKQLLESINIENVTVAGDTRFDRVYSIASQSKGIELAKRFSNGSKILIAGSTWPRDEDFLAEYINKEKGSVKYIIAPHEISEAGIVRLERLLKVSSIRFSRADVAIVDDKKVLIIDNVGMLSTLYKYGNVAYIGGGFGKGIHNILEAAVFGQPVLFGPNYLKFSEAVGLINEKGAFTFSDYAQMEEFLNRFFENEEELDKVSSISMNFVKMRIGATEKILNKIS